MSHLQNYWMTFYEICFTSNVVKKFEFWFRLDHHNSYSYIKLKWNVISCLMAASLALLIKYEGWVASSGMVFIPSSIKICPVVQKLFGEEEAHRYDHTYAFHHEIGKYTNNTITSSSSKIPLHSTALFSFFLTKFTFLFIP